ncbi:MAG: response regulator [Gemmatimonadaceae bacterium]|nr:response regulator [Chitinophagaceae bacterium]
MPATTLQSARTKKVLVIEDEGDMCLVLDLLLNSSTTEVDHVKSLGAAREYISSASPELIVLDNRLPDGFGIDFIRFIKEKLPNARIIMMSGIDLAAKDLALESGADSFLEKPFTKAQLMDSVNRLLN